MRSTQDQWTKVVEVELKKQTEKPEEIVGGLAEYCIALANDVDQIKSADNTEALLGRLEPQDVTAKRMRQCEVCKGRSVRAWYRGELIVPRFEQHDQRGH